jgi:hypothetical protein
MLAQRQQQVEGFWSERDTLAVAQQQTLPLMEARQRKEHETMREIELRCDGVAVIALRRLGLDPAKLVSAISRMRMLNARIVDTDPLYHPQPDGRSRFIHAMSELAKRRGADFANVD